MKKILLLLFIVFISCDSPSESPLEIALASKRPAIRNVMENPSKFEVQILFTQIEEDANGNTTFTDYSYQLDAKNYFYPASSVKLPAAVLALELLDKTEGISPLTPYSITGDSIRHTVAGDVKQIFAVSDNDAYNRLYELLGRDYINKSLRGKGLQPVRIAHRLEVENAANAQCDTLRFNFGINLGGGKDLPIENISAENLKKGLGFMRNDSLISEAMDFSEKNYFPLETQHNLMKRLFFEKNFSAAERFELTASSKKLLQEAMYTVPRKAGYNEGEFYDSYVKFLMYGDTRGRIQDHIKIYNKVGFAYGTLTDTALITDEKANISFLLSATITVNENGIFNDDIYEYEAIGLPFLAQLGRELYNLELERKKPIE